MTPAPAILFLAGKVPAQAPPVVRWTRGGYERLLRNVAQHPRTLLAAVFAFAFAIANCAALPFFGCSFIPELKEGHFIVHMTAVPGTSLDESLRLSAFDESNAKFYVG